MADLPAKGPSAVQEALQGIERSARLVRWVFALHEVLAWFEKVSLTGVNLKWQRPGWLLVVTGRQYSHPVVAFVYGDDPEDCYLNLARMVRQGRMRWRPDKYRGTGSKSTSSSGDS